MHSRSIIHVLGLLLVVTGSSMFLPAICSTYYHEADLLPIIYSSLISITFGLPSGWYFRKHNDLHIKDSIFISDTGKWFLRWNMMVGRLEMFSALVILYPLFWKK